METKKIPSPHELLLEQNAADDHETDEVIARIVARLRADATQQVCVTGSMRALTKASHRMEARGWVCRIYEGLRDSDPMLMVYAPKSAMRSAAER